MMSSRRRRRRGGPVLLIIVVAALALLTWWVWPNPQSTDQPPTQPPVAAIDPLTAPSRPVPQPHQIEFEPPVTHSATLPETPPAGPQVTPSTAQATPPAAIQPAPAVASIPESSAAPESTQPPPSVEPPPAVSPERSPTQVLMQAAALIRSGDVVEARRVLSSALRARDLSPADSAEVRGVLEVLNDGMIFGPEVTPGDPYTRLYEIRSGDALSRIANREAVKTNWRFIQRINGINDPSRIRVGQRIKLVQGPFHAEVEKGSHRIDVWLGEGDEAIFVRSLPVGLGEFNSTPQGAFRVRRGGKMKNPSWTNPRTGEQFGADDPKNPIGEYWIGLDGIDQNNLQERGFGIHGTIEPDSIGQDRSMGCVRLADADIALVYEMLTEANSVVLIRE